MNPIELAEEYERLTQLGLAAGMDVVGITNLIFAKTGLHKLPMIYEYRSLLKLSAENRAKVVSGEWSKTHALKVVSQQQQLKRAQGEVILEQIDSPKQHPHSATEVDQAVQQVFEATSNALQLLQVADTTLLHLPTLEDIWTIQEEFASLLKQIASINNGPKKNQIAEIVSDQESFSDEINFKVAKSLAKATDSGESTTISDIATEIEEEPAAVRYVLKGKKDEGKRSFLVDLAMLGLALNIEPRTTKKRQPFEAFYLTRLSEEEEQRISKTNLTEVPPPKGAKTIPPEEWNALNIIEQAKLCAELSEKVGSAKNIARLVPVSRDTVLRRLQILTFPEEVQNAFASGELQEKPYKQARKIMESQGVDLATALDILKGDFFNQNTIERFCRSCDIRRPDQQRAFTEILQAGEGFQPYPNHIELAQACKYLAQMHRGFIRKSGNSFNTTYRPTKRLLETFSTFSKHTTEAPTS